jgi:hydrophobic/amphiphilic exporter-1 (mainly G- bacteria), HAE1 family
MKTRLVNWIFNNLKIIFLLFLFLVIFGATSLSQMQRQGFPEVIINIASVQVIYPDANAKQIEKDVLKPIEQTLEDIEHVTEYETIANDAFGMAIITFDQKLDPKEAFAEIKTEIQSISFPEGAQEPVIETFSAGGPGEFIIAASGIQDSWQLYEEGEILKQKLENVDGVKLVTELNPITPEVSIVFNEELLAENNISRQEAESAIQLAEFSSPVGSFEHNGKQSFVSLQKQINSLSALENLFIKPDVQLKNVATISTQLNNHDQYNRIGYRTDQSDLLQIDRALLYAVKINADADIISVASELNTALEQLSEDRQHVGEYVTVYSQAESTELQIEEITSSIFGSPIDSLGSFAFLGYLFGGLSLVVILLFIFMNFRIAILAASTIPLSLLFTAIYLSLVDIQLNTLVLFAMVLTVGLVVDPTIVFLESMQRLKARGMTGRAAARKTMDTVGLGIFLAVSTNILVFVPFGIVSGFFGEIIKYIPATIIPAMIASMLIPVFFFMPLASKILSSKKKETPEGIQAELIGTWSIGRNIGKGIQWMLGKGKLKVGLRFLTFLLVISMPIITWLALSGAGAIQVVQFSGQGDSDFILVNGSVTNEWTFQTAVNEVIVPLQDAMTEFEEIKHFSYFEQNGNSFSILVQLLPIQDREELDLRTSEELSKDMNAAIEALSLNAEIEASTSSEGPPQDAYPVRIRLVDNDIDKLHVASEDIQIYLQGVEGVSVVEDNISDPTSGGSIVFVLDNNEPLAQNPMLTFSLLTSRLSENTLGSVTLHDQQYKIQSSITPEINSKNELTSIHVPNPEELIYEQTLAALIEQGVPNPELLIEKPEPVLIQDLIQETQANASQSIRRINGNRYVEIFANVKEGADTMQIQSDLEAYLTDEKLAEFGLTSSATEFKGEADSITQSFSDLFLALGVAIFLIYVLLVGFFKSYLEPFIILFAIPLGLVGVFAAVAITTGQLGFLELLGVVVMAGIVVNVTILLIDFANQLRRQGKTAAEAISTSVAVRLRPIVLTQLTAFGSLIPLVFLSPFWKGLAAAIIFGIASSAFFSLLLTPILYQWVDTFAQLPEKIRTIAIRLKKQV